MRLSVDAGIGPSGIAMRRIRFVDRAIDVLDNIDQ
jgi:hypothetical protein